MIYSETSALLRMHQAWRDQSVCIRPDLVRKSSAGERWQPSNAEEIARQILARFDPDQLS